MRRLTTQIGYAIVHRHDRFAGRTGSANTAKIYATVGIATAAAKQSKLSEQAFKVTPIFIEEQVG